MGNIVDDLLSGPNALEGPEFTTIRISSKLKSELDKHKIGNEPASETFERIMRNTKIMRDFITDKGLGKKFVTYFVAQEAMIKEDIKT